MVGKPALLGEVGASEVPLQGVSSDLASDAQCDGTGKLRVAFVQLIVSVDGPSHCLPPFLGDGATHFLIRLRRHAASHSDGQGSQRDHAP